MKKTFHIFSMTAVAAIMLAATSCTDFLTIYPTDRVVLEDFWKDKSDVETMVANSYKNMVSNDFISRLIVWGELRSDDVIETTNINTTLKYINNANLLETNTYCNWSVFYKVINNCNIVLKFAPQVMDEDPDFQKGDLDVVRGEMLATRAFCHFWLVRAFRDIPLLLEAKVDDSQNLYILQSEPLAALDSILVDLDEAEGLVLESGAYANMTYNKGRFTADAVRALRADVLLWKAAFTQCKNESDGSENYQTYSECIDYCERIIADRIAYIEDYNEKNDIEEGIMSGEGPAYELVKQYPLILNSASARSTSPYNEQSYYEIFGQQNNLKESIFELQLDDQNNRNYAIPTFYGYEGATRQFNASTILGKSGEDNSLYKETDLRCFSNTIQNGEEEDVYPIAKYVTTYTEPTSNGKAGAPKYRESLKDDSGSDYTTSNWIVYRITDVMLMEAEALALRHDSIKGDLKKAFNLVKAVYYRSNPKNVARNDSITYTENNYESMMSLVMDERHRELCFESKRWFDLVRMALREGDTKGMLDEMVPNKYENNQSAIRSKMASLDCLFFPIYERELDTDSTLVQNPAYVTEDVYSKN